MQFVHYAYCKYKHLGQESFYTVTLRIKLYAFKFFIRKSKICLIIYKVWFMTVIVKAKYFVFRDFVIRQRNLDVEKTLCWSVGNHLDEQATRFRYCLVSMGIR